MIEQPFAGRATIIDNLTAIEIIIPARKNWLVSAFLCLWLCGWLFGEIMVGKNLFLSKSILPVNLFLFAWLAMWTIGGLFALNLVLWNIFGKEFVTVGNGILTIHKKGSFFSKPKSYDLMQISNVIAKEIPFYQQGSKGFRNYMNRGTISFDYGFKTIRFGDGLEEPESRHIIEILRTKKLIH